MASKREKKRQIWQAIFEYIICLENSLQYEKDFFKDIL